MPESTGRAIELEEGSEAEIIESNEYIFDQIGSAVPISPSNSKFDPSTVPSQPLVVSEQHRLLFIAHTDGFLVAKTLDVIRFAKEIKERGTGPSLKELCVVDVCVGKVQILALSTDSKMLAACVGGDIHFYSVESLLNKEQTSHASCSLDAPEYVKDMRWKNRNEKSYIVLSNSGRLYHGVVGGSLEHVFDDVDAVEWSVNQSLVAMARKNVLSVLTHDFKETLSMSLCFDSWVDGSDDDYSVKVDSVRWCRPDCIILGCLLVKADGTEENYLVQAISVKEGSFANTSIEPIVSSFSELFTGITDDIVTSGKGPHLFLCYLRQCELGIIANKKNVDQHINLITWLTGDLNSEIALIYFNRDKWAPRIPLQDDGDDNVVVGLSLDEVSMNEKVRFQKGVDDPKELSPYCIMFCLTLEGKLIMFHLASILDNQTIHQGTMLPDEETTCEASDVRTDQLKFDPEIKQPAPTGSISLGPEENDTNDSKIRIPNQLKVDPIAKQPTLNCPVLRFSSQEVSNYDQLQVQKSEGIKRNETSDSTMRIYDQLKVDPDTKQQQLKGSFLSFQSQGASKNDLFQVERNEVPKRNDIFDSATRIPDQLKEDPDTKQQQLKGSFLNFQSQGVSKNNPFQMERREVPKRNSTNDLTMRISDQVKVDPETKQQTVKGSVIRFQSQEVSNIDQLQMKRSEGSKRNDTSDSNMRIPDNGFRSEYANKGTKPLPLELPTDASLSKGSTNIKEMTEQLDKLLKDLEEMGGFADFSTGQRNTAEALSLGLEALACKCKTWKVTVKEHQEEIQNLLNKTVQVLARKTYLESIVKQATDTQYWDLWDRQGLGFELEMKHRNIIKIHQDLTNQLIQLEMHFNNMELNKFGKKDRSYDNNKGLQNRLREPRHIQSLNSLQNTMNSQLVVAEQLSLSLSEQMALLNVDSPCSKQQNVKRDLFKTIGLPLDDASSFNSPGYSSFEKHAVPSLSSSVQILPKRNQTTGKKNHEPETARRRRESLGRSWVDFEPRKTTVRRSQLPEGRKPNIGNPSSIPCMLEESISSLQKERRTPSTLHPSHNRVAQEAVAVESKKTSQFKWVNNDTGLFKTEGAVSSAKASVMPFSFPSISSKPLFGHSSANSTGSLTNEIAVVEGSSGNGLNDTKLPLLADRTNSDTPKKSPTTSQLHVHLNRSTSPGNFSISSKGVSSEIPALGGNISLLNAGSSQNHSSSQVYSFPASSSTTATTSLMKSKVNVASESRPSESVLPTISLTPILGDHMPQGAKNRSSEEIKPQFSGFGASVFHTSSFSLKLKDAAVSEANEQKEEKSNEQSSFGGIANVGVSVSPNINSSKNEASAEPEKNIQKEWKLGEPTSFGGFANVGESASPTSGFSLKLEGAAASEQIVKEERKLSEPSTFSGTVNAEPNSMQQSQLEQPLPTFNGIASTDKAEASSNADYQEDEMEEQAPEVSPELSLGNLGGFGLGSTPSQGSATPSRNPFGGSLENSSASPVSSPFFKPSSGGEMFRPASFSFAPTQHEQQQAPSQPTTAVGRFGSSATPFGFAANQAPSGGGFGQPAQVGQGQQALGSALGSFGQSRQIGFGQPANNFAPTSGFGSGFGGNQSAGGFANVAPKSGGFASLASNSGGFAAAASTTSGGFATPGGFAGAAAPVGGSGFGGFAGASGSGAGFGAGGTGFGQKGSSFSSFGGTGAQPPAQIFTQMRK